MNIRFASSEAGNICSVIRSAKLKGSAATDKISRARHIDADISSKLNISADLMYLTRSVQSELQQLGALATALESAESLFEDADQSIRSRTKRMTMRILSAKAEVFWEVDNGALLSRRSTFNHDSNTLLELFCVAGAFASSSLITGGTIIAILRVLRQIITGSAQQGSDSAENSEQQPAASGAETNQKTDEALESGAQTTDEAMQKEIQKLLQSEEFLGADWPEGEMRQITLETYKRFISRVGDIMGISVYGNFNYDSSRGYAGWFSPKYPTTIFVNKLLIGNYSDYSAYEQALKTIVHEMRHAYQYAAIQNPGEYPVEQATLEQWTSEMENYVGVDESFRGYADQACEVDARNFTSDAFQGI